MSRPDVASSSVRAMLAGFAALGLDAARVRDEVEIAEAELADPDRYVPFSRVYRMWQVAQRLWDKPGLGLLCGARVPFGAYEVLDYLAASGESLGEGLSQVAKYFGIVTNSVSFEINDEGSHVAFEMVWRVAPEGVTYQLRDYMLALIASRVRSVACCPSAPAHVELAGPPLARDADYARVFGAPTLARAERSAVVFSSEAWRLRGAHQDATLHLTLQRHAELLLRRTEPLRHEQSIDRVRREVLRQMRVGPPTIEAVARALAVGPRTLQRHLQREGVAYSALVDEVRTLLAREYLRDRGVTVTEVAYLLGFSQTSAFSRAFRRWTGATPRAFRVG